MSTVWIAHHEEIEQAISDALGSIDLEPLIRGKLVAVKPNDTYATAQDKTGVTQPDTLRAVLRAVRAFGPRELVVTGGSGAGETDAIFRIAGLMDVVQQEGARFFDHNKPPFQAVKLDYAPGQDVAGPQASVMVNPRALEYETLIAVNQLKVHQTATITLGLKNIAMSFPAADYYGHPRAKQDHPHEFFQDMSSFIAAMAKRFPIQLSITVGHPAMIGHGPLDGIPVETGLVIASTDPLAADAAGARLLGFNVEAVHHLWEAARLGLGETQIEKIDFPGIGIQEAVGIFTQAAYGKKLQY